MRPVVRQTLHHLFPSVHPCHYPPLAVLARPVFAKHELPMAGWTRGYADALGSLVQHLWRLSEDR